MGSRVGLVGTTIVMAALAVLPRAAQAAVPVAARAELGRAADVGPAAIADALAGLLRKNPKLAATPDSAADLARVVVSVAAPLVGERLPLYRECERLIVAAAPVEQKKAVGAAIARVLVPYVLAEHRPAPLPGGHPPAPPPAPPPQNRGHRFGPITVYPSLQVGGLYDDNTYATRSGHVADWIGLISPRVALRGHWAHASLYAQTGADLTGYWTHGAENTADWHALAEGRADVDADTQVLVGGVAMKDHEDRASPDAVEGFSPTPYWDYNAYTGLIHKFGALNVRVGAAVERLLFGNVNGSNGEIDNEARDRNRYTFGVLVRDEARRGFQPFVEAFGDIRRYDRTTDLFGYARNSDGYRAGIGARFRLDDQLSGEVFAGAVGRSYADPRFNPIVTYAVDGELRWQVLESTALVLFADRSIEETTLSGSPGYIYSVIGGRVEHRITPRLTGFLRLAGSRSEFQQATRWDNELDTSIGARYNLTDSTYIRVDYRYTERVSGESAFNFARNQVYIVLGTEF